MKVFYSWQSDTPNKVGRTFIRECLDAAIESLDLEEAVRPVVDQDTAGVLGSPVIADTIFQKIRAAKVVVADVTLTGQTADGKRLCNSNVAIELGFALGTHGDEVLLKIMNTHYGAPADLPFDLAHRRWPVQFDLSPDAEKSQRQKVSDVLAKELRAILNAYIAASRPPAAQFVPTPATYNPAAYWQKGETLATVGARDGDGGSRLYATDVPLTYLRIWPSEPIPPLTTATLRDANRTSIEPLGGGIGGWSFDRNRYGMLTHAAHPSTGELASTTQILKTGEIWGVNEHLLRKEEGYPYLVPTSAYEQGIRASLLKYLSAARNAFNYPARVFVESGLVNVSGFKLAISNRQFWGPIYDDVRVVKELDMDNAGSINEVLLSIFDAVFDAAGVPRPKNFDNFPGPGS